MQTNTRDLGFVDYNNEEMQFVIYNGMTVYEAWKRLTVKDIPPLTLPKCKGVDLIDYKIYGNSVQDGIPTPEAPIEVESVGRKSTNMYKFPYDYMTQKINGITFTALSDGRVHAKGKQTTNLNSYSPYYGNTWKEIVKKFEIGKTYYMDINASSPAPTGCRYYMMGIINKADGSVTYPSTSFKLSEGDVLSGIQLRIYSTDGVLRDIDVEFSPMVSEVTSEFEPYGKYIVPITSKCRGEIEVKDDVYSASNIFNTESKNQIIKRECVRAVSTTWLMNATSIETFIENPVLEVGTYIWSIRDEDGVAIKNPYIQLETSEGTIDWNVNTSITLTEKATIIALRCASTNFYVGNTQQFRIQIEKGEEITEPITTKIYLDEPLKEDEVISFSEDNLPPIPTHKGTTIIEVDTTIQPSNIEVQYYGKGVA